MARLAWIIAALLVLSVAVPAAADHNNDLHSPNMGLVGNFTDAATYSDGSDIAFWGDLAIFGNLDPGGFRVLDISDPTAPKEIGQFACPGSQSDVSVWEDLVFVSVDSTLTGPNCGDGSAGQTAVAQGQVWEGIRIVSIADPADPVYLASVDTDCGSHTHTLVPDTANDRVLLYVLSYPLTEHGVECNVVGHRKISVIEVPLDDPTAAKVVSTPSVSPAIGCHDVTVFMPEKLAAAACLTESQIWDISDPVNPTILSHIVNPLINIHHSAAFSWDGDTVVLGDELGGAAAAAGCLTDGNAPLGALWFYDVSNPASPAMRGSFVIPGTRVTLECTAHNFNIIPLPGDRDILVSAWYTGGTTIVDFTDPANPEQIGFYIPSEGAPGNSWSSYWYNGYIYANNLGDRGIDVLRLEDALVENALALPHLNAQVQEGLPAPKSSGGGTQVRGRRQVLPRTGAGAWYAAGLALLAAAGVLRRLLRGSS